MSSSKPIRGRPRRKEGTKHITFKNSTYKIWKERKERMGLSALNNSEFAEVLLHRVNTVIEEETDSEEACGIRKRKRTAPARSRKQLWSTPASTRHALQLQSSPLALSPIEETKTESEVNVDVTGETSRSTSSAPTPNQKSQLDSNESSQSRTMSMVQTLRRVNPSFGSLEGDPFENSYNESLSSEDDEEREEVDDEEEESSNDVGADESGENDIEYRSEEDDISLPDDSATLTALEFDVDETMQEESIQINEQQPLQQFGPQTEDEVNQDISKMLEVEFTELTKVEEDLTDYADKLKLQRVMTEVSKIEELFSGKCEDEHCQKKRKIVHRSLESAVLTITYCCPNGHSGVWSSSSVLTKKRGQNVFVSTVVLSAGILTTGNNFDKISLLFKFLNCSFISKATYNRIQSLHVIPAIKELWTLMKEKVESVLKETTVLMCGDGRMDSPGFSAKYCVYSIMDHKLGVIIDIEVVDKRETGGSSTIMEKMALKRLIERLLEKFIIGELTTDASATILKLIRDLKDMHRDKLEQLFHSLDIWHKSCKLTANLTKAYKTKGNEAIKEWIEPIRNHFWHCAEISHGDENTLKDAWIGVVHHICGEHEWADGSCAHGPLTNLESENKCLLKDSKPFKAVQEIIFDKRWLTTLKHYVFFRHTSQLESFNSMMLKYAPKRNAFSNDAFSARVELAALDNNFHLFRRVIPDRGKKTYSKRSKNWKIQSVKEEKSYKYWLLLGSKILKRRVDDKEAVTRHIEVPANHPINLAPSIAMRAAPPTEELLQAKRSRFHSKH